MFKGRQIEHSELGMNVLKRVEEAVSDLGKCSVNNKLKGPQILMVIQPHMSR